MHRVERGDRQDMETHQQGAGMTADIVTETAVPQAELAESWFIVL
jgi:hypothetical protein